MPLFRLSGQQTNRFSEMVEAAPGVHLAKIADADDLSFVLGERVLLVPDETARDQVAALLKQSWLQTRDRVEHEERAAGFDRWLSGLSQAPRLQAQSIPRSVLAFKLHPHGYLPTTLSRPALIYGHLPFSGTTGASDIFYRCEPWPTSRRISQANQEVAAGTYACPQSELPFFPTGFAAVGRYALPNLAPACFRWELQPLAGTVVDCGASVPLYGQAGGGVEVYFRKKTKNRRPIANPTILPAL